MRSVLAFLLCGALAAAAPAARPLSDFGLTEAELEHYGFKDADSVLKDTVRNAIYTGADREKVLDQIGKWRAEEAQRSRGRTEEGNSAQGWGSAASAYSAAQAAAGADAQAAVYDGQKAAPDAGEEVIAAWRARQPKALERPLPPPSRTIAVPAPPSQTADPLGLQGRGTVDKIIGLVIGSLPGPDLAEVARRLTDRATGSSASADSLPRLCRAASQRCLNELLSQYYGEKKAQVAKDDRYGAWAARDDAVFVKYGQGKKAPGEYLELDARVGETEAQELIALGFRRELGLGEDVAVRVILSPDGGVSKNRGVWLSNPVLRRKDGSFDLIFSEKVVASAVDRGTDLMAPLRASRSRDHLLGKILAGEDPVGLGRKANCLLLGWMQAQTLRELEESAAAGHPAEKARRQVQEGILTDPLKSRLYAIANNAQTTSRWDFDHRVDSLEGDGQARDPELWAMISQANAGDGQAREAFLAALKRRKAAVAAADAVQKRVEEKMSQLAQEVVALDQSDPCRRVEALKQKAQEASYAAALADQEVGAAVDLKKGQAEIASLQEASARAHAQVNKAEADMYSAEQDPQYLRILASQNKLIEASNAVNSEENRAYYAAAEARGAWERASGYLDYLQGEIPEKLAQELDLPADFKAKQLRRAVLSGDKAATERFAAMIVSAESAAARLSYQGRERASDPVESVQEGPRPLGEGDQRFLDAFLPAVYARPELRDDYRAIVSAMAQAKGQRLYDAILARDNGFWPRFFAVFSGDDAAALYAQAPEPVQEKMRAAAAGCAPPARAFLAKVKAAPVPELDAQEERLLQRATSLNKQFSVLDAAGQKVESRYNAYPMMIMEYLQEPDVLRPILEASRRTGMDPYLISAVAFQEGYNVFAEAVENGEGTGKTYYFHSLVGPMGLDTFPGSVEEMKKRGWIRPDFSEYRVTQKPSGWDYGDADFLGPEPAETALEAMVGLIRKKRAQFLGDAGRLNIRAAGISRQEMELWTYLYFNFTEPKKILAKYGTGWVWKPSKPGQDVYNVKRVGATAEWLRELKFFDGFWAADKLGH